jgi:hypothetical protein
VLNHSVGLLPRLPGEVHQVLGIAVRAEDRRGQDPEHPEALIPGAPQHARHRIGADRGIGHEPAAHRGAPHLELRLDEQHDVGVGGGGRRDRGEHERRGR